MLLRISVFISLLITFGSCVENYPNAQQTTEKESVVSVTPAQSSPLKQEHDPKFIYTEKQYSDSSGNSFTIINSLPKGGLDYTSPVGKNTNTPSFGMKSQMNLVFRLY